MAIASNLGNLIYDIDRTYAESCDELAEFSYIPEVASFLKRRKSDLINFEKMTASFNRTMSVFEVKSRLEEILPRDRSKYFGGICLKGADYFKLTKKVRKAVNEEIAEIQRQAIEEEKEQYLNFDKNFCIPDELDQETMNEMYE